MMYQPGCPDASQVVSNPKFTAPTKLHTSKESRNALNLRYGQSNTPQLQRKPKNCPLLMSFIKIFSLGDSYPELRNDPDASIQEIGWFLSINDCKVEPSEQLEESECTTYHQNCLPRHRSCSTPSRPPASQGTGIFPNGISSQLCFSSSQVGLLPPLAISPV